MRPLWAAGGAAVVFEDRRKGRGAALVLKEGGLPCCRLTRKEIPRWGRLWCECVLGKMAMARGRALVVGERSEMEERRGRSGGWPESKKKKGRCFGSGKEKERLRWLG
ncbi:hypothetical protein H0E87_028336, partial [Populus deltoides]